jgi:hypothetical protein
MSQLTKAAYETKYNDSSTGLYKAGQTQGIGSDDHRTQVTDHKDSLLWWLDHVKDEDNMASDSASHVPTQQSVKAYVDSHVPAALAWKNPCKAATTANITLSGTQTIDGISIIAGDRVLVKDQTAATENGIYQCAAGAWSRATDADSAAELEGAAVIVQQGTASADTTWVQTTDGITLGSSNIVWAALGTSVPDATETVKGKVELATTAEVIAGTDTVRAVTPAGVRAAAWYLTGTNTLGGVTNITSNSANQLIFDGTWTAGANNDFHINFAGAFTGRASQTGDDLFGYVFSPTLTAGSPSNNEASAVRIAPTFSGTWTRTTALDIVTGDIAIGDDVILRRSAASTLLLTRPTAGVSALQINGNQTSAGSQNAYIVLSGIASGPSLHLDARRGANHARIWADMTPGLAIDGSTLQLNYATSNGSPVYIGTGGLGIGTTSITASTRADIRGANDTTGNILRLANNSNVERLTHTGQGDFSITQGAQTASWGKAFLSTPGAHTGMTASTEFVSRDFAGATQQWSTGSLTTQRFNWFRGYTMAFVGASTVTDAYNVYIDDLTAGTNATIIGRWALGVAGNVNITQSVHTGGSPVGFQFVAGAHTTLAAGGGIPDVWFVLGRTVQRATGSCTEVIGVAIENTTYSFVGSSTVTDAYALKLTGAQAAGANATITNSHGLYIGSSTVNPSGTVTNAFSLSVVAPTGATNNYAAQFSGGLGLLLNDINVVLGTTTGTKFGSATSQKLGFWNATPIVQPTTGISAASFTANSGTTVNDASTFDGYTLGQVVKALRNTGLLA